MNFQGLEPVPGQLFASSQWATFSTKLVHGEEVG